MIKYQVESFKDCLEELKPLFEKHYKEVALYTDVIKLSPDYDKYFFMEDNNMLHLVTCRDEEGSIVGYCITFVGPHPHYKEDKYGQNDIVFVEESYRGTEVPAKMMSLVEKEMRGMGVSVMTIHMKTEFPFEKLANGLGFEKVEYIYSKCLRYD